MTTLLDLEPAARNLARVIGRIGNEQLLDPTPCGTWSVEELLDHLFEVTLGLARAGRKRPRMDKTDQIPTVASTPGWGEQLQRQTLDVALAWAAVEAWDGTSEAGRLKLPAKVLGVVALAEIVVHGWDLAQATGQAFDITAESGEAVAAFFDPLDAKARGTNFGPPLERETAKNSIERVVVLSGRDPNWRVFGT